MKNIIESEKEWRAESDPHTLIEAERIRKDAKRMKAVKEAAKKQLAAMSLVENITIKK